MALALGLLLSLGGAVRPARAADEQPEGGSISAERATTAPDHQEIPVPASPITTAITPSRTFLPPPAPLPADPAAGGTSQFPPPPVPTFDPSNLPPLPSGMPPLPPGMPPLPPLPPGGLPPLPPGVALDPKVPPLPPAPTAPMQPPVNFEITSITISAKERLAILAYEQQTYVVQVGAMVPHAAQPVFDVRAIDKDSVTVFDRRINRIVIKAFLH